MLTPKEATLRVVFEEPEALGIMLFIMIAGYSPFDAPEVTENPSGSITKRLAVSICRFRKRVPNHRSGSAAGLFNLCLFGLFVLVQVTQIYKNIIKGACLGEVFALDHHDPRERQSVANFAALDW